MYTVHMHTLQPAPHRPTLCEMQLKSILIEPSWISIPYIKQLNYISYSQNSKHSPPIRVGRMLHKYAPKYSELRTTSLFMKEMQTNSAEPKVHGLQAFKLLEIAADLYPLSLCINANAPWKYVQLWKYNIY